MPDNLKPEQLKVINHENGNILVSASAGSGKTFVMIKRLIRLISEGKAGVNEILAATFTEAAAADMKEKLKTALLEEIEKGNDYLAKELTKISTADICTLHSFCGRLIRTYFFATGIAPDYKVADESEASSLKEESLEETFAEFYAENNPDFLTLIDRYRSKRKDQALKSIIKDIYDFCESETEPFKLLSAFSENFTESGAKKFIKESENLVVSTAKAVTEEILSLTADCESAGYTAGAGQTSEFLEIVTNIVNGGINKASEYAEESAYPKITAKRPPEGKEFLKDRLKAVKERIVSICDYSLNAGINPEELKSLSEIGNTFKLVVEKYAEIYSRKKRENNLLDFADLEKFALKALKDSSVREAVRDKYKYVFVDEYQDINGVQEAIISAITNNNLFMVGDVKQSIYGFRGCRAEIFERKQQTIEDGGGVNAELNCNFRSAKAVIDLVNKVFDFCYIPKYTGLDYKNTARLLSGGIYPDGAEGRAELHYLIKEKREKAEKGEPHIYNVLEEAKKEEEKDAAAISNLLSEIIYEELDKTIYDVKLKKFRRVTMGDIAVLTRAGDSAYVKGIVEGLNGHDIRVVSGVSQNVCDFPEIKTLIASLQLVDCFYQDAPLVCTLLSPIGGFTEEELIDVALFYQDGAKMRGGFSDAFSYYLENADTTLKQKLVDFKDYFSLIRELADFKGAKGILEKIISDKGYENFLLAEKDGEEKLNRLYKFMAETVVGGRTLSVSEFLRRTENSEKAFEFFGGGEEDAVKIMTIHSSKGLEFPVVIVCGLEKPFSRKDEIKPVLFDRNSGFFPCSFDDEHRTFKTNGYRELIKAKAHETQLKEEMRLFYVALTRAEYSLHLVFEKNADTRSDVFAPTFTDGGSFLDFVPSYIPAKSHSPTKFGLIGLKRRGREILVGKIDERAKEKMERDFGFSYPYVKATALPLKNSVTSAIKDSQEEIYPVRALFTDAEELGETDAERGTIAHAIMEHYDFNGEFYSQMQKIKSSGKIPEEDFNKVDLERLKRAIESGAFNGIKDKKLYREQDFIVNIPADKLFNCTEKEEVLVQGIIDLLAIAGDSAEIIDYKYSKLSAENIKNKYYKQLDLYAYAVEKALHIKVVKKTLVNIYTGEYISVD